jgi:hypothetical protein
MERGIAMFPSLSTIILRFALPWIVRLRHAMVVALLQRPHRESEWATPRLAVN